MASVGKMVSVGTRRGAIPQQSRNPHSLFPPTPQPYQNEIRPFKTEGFLLK